MPDAAAGAILALLTERRQGASICPSEAARRLDPEAWHSRMDEVREAAGRLSDARHVCVTQRGVEVDPKTAKGPIRIVLPRVI